MERQRRQRGKRKSEPAIVGKAASGVGARLHAGGRLPPVNLSWNDTRNDPTRVGADIFYTRSTDGGITLSANLQVTTAPTSVTSTATISTK